MENPGSIHSKYFCSANHVLKSAFASLAKEGNVVHFSGKARKMNHLSFLRASEASGD
ncbi:MAG: hypothetical protein U5L45_04785 [Saprospiraceae bacterium]|nr:hypothetical protein [Saprospiraceae bacterium]